MAPPLRPRLNAEAATAASVNARAGRSRRRHPSTETMREYSADELEFLRALDRFKIDKHTQFPTAIDHLDVLKSLGYRKSECQPVEQR